MHSLLQVIAVVTVVFVITIATDFIVIDVPVEDTAILRHDTTLEIHIHDKLKVCYDMTSRMIITQPR